MTQDRREGSPVVLVLVLVVAVVAVFFLVTSGILAMLFDPDTSQEDIEAIMASHFMTMSSQAIAQ
ncbi:MAG: hypothetical protein K0S37_1938 [Microbacterium sp.]|jgi:uncharacterized RDD family membrane protein YckC|nr:hypothetical protein [Microbacterium sp.]